MTDGNFVTELVASIGPVARQLLGDPNKDLSDDDVLRFGTHGSMAVNVGGEKRGTWYDHEAKEGGGVIDLVQHCKRSSREDALAWLKQTGKVSNSSLKSPTARRIVATYPYTDADGTVLYEVVRYEPKDFRQRRPDPEGGWDWSMKGQRLVPFRLPSIVAAPREAIIYVVEGEKDVLALEALGLVATCNAGGAGKWPKRDLRAAGCARIFAERVSSVAKRAQLEAAIDHLREGDTLVVTKPDRLARSVADLLGIIARLEAMGVALRVLSMGGAEVNTGTPTGRLMLTMLGAVAEFERALMLERQREGIAKAKAEGKYKGRAPTAQRQAAKVLRLKADGVRPVDIARRLGIGRASVYRILGGAPQ